MGQLDGSRVVRVSIDLPRSDHPLYVFRGAQHVQGGLQLFGDSNGAFNLALGIPGAGSGDVVPLDRQRASIRAHVKNLDARGDLYILVYERID